MGKTSVARFAKLELYVDSKKNSIYSGAMRWQTVIVLIAVAFTIVAPHSFAIAVGHDQEPVLGMLDVCHSAAPALASNGEMPCMNECPCRHVPASPVAYNKQTNPLFSEFLLITRNERPPQK